MHPLLSSHGFRIAVVLAAALAAYGNALDGPFVLDDFHNIRDNRHVRVASLAPAALLDAAFASPSPNRPVANLTFALNYYLGGYETRGYHLVNVVIHGLNGIVVYLLVLVTLRLAAPGGARAGPAAWLAALVFVLHPVQIESVTYVVQRMTSLAAGFYLLSLLLYAHARDRGPGPGRRWLAAGSVAAGVLALGAKEIAVTLPLAILLYEWFFFRDLDRAWLARGLPLALLAAAGAVALGLLYLGPDPLRVLASAYDNLDFSPGERVLTQFRVLVFYIGLVLLPLPSRLGLSHPFPASESFLEPLTTLLAAAVVAGLLCLACAAARRHRVAAFAVIWFFLTQALEASFLGLEMAFEHRLYLPMAGVALLAARGFTALPAPRRTAASVAAAVLLGALALATRAENEVWRSRIALWSSVIAQGPENPRAHVNLGQALEDAGDLAAAESHYRAAVALAPRDPRTRLDLGVALLKQGRAAAALDHLAAAVERAPSLAPARNALGLALATLGRRDEAAVEYLAALHLEPDLAETYLNFAALVRSGGDRETAIALLERAVALEPGLAAARNNLGTALATAGDLAAAERHLRAAMALEPGSAAARGNLGLVLARRGRLDEAIVRFEEALSLDPEHREARRNLAVVLRERARRIAAAGGE